MVKVALVTGAGSGIGRSVATALAAAGFTLVLTGRRAEALEETAARSVPIEELSFQEWQAVVGVNLTGAFLCAQEAVRLMKSQKPQGGRIINNGSVSAHVPRPNSAPYTSTKHAMTGLTKSLALDGRAFDITCGQIDIGNAQTELAERLAAETAKKTGSTSAEATMKVDDVARAVVYMASLPLQANVLFMTVMANKMPFVGRG